MEASRSVVSTKLRLQATEALRRARRLPVGPHRNDLRQLAIGLRGLELRERQDEADSVVIGAGAIADCAVTVPRVPAPAMPA